MSIFLDFIFAVLAAPTPQPWQRLLPRHVPDYALALGWSNMHRLHPFMHDLAVGGSAHVLVFGGSEASGVNCVEGELKFQECAWPARVARWLSSRFPAATVAHDSYARGGTTTASNLPALPGVLKSVDAASHGASLLVLLDWCVNDGSLVRRQMPAGSEFAIDSLAGLPRRKGVSVALEKAIMLVKQWLPNATIVGVLLPSADCYFVRDAYRVVYAHHGLPLLDFTVMWLALQDGNHSYSLQDSHTAHTPHTQHTQHTRHTQHTHPCDPVRTRLSPNGVCNTGTRSARMRRVWTSATRRSEPAPAWGYGRCASMAPARVAWR